MQWSGDLQAFALVVMPTQVGIHDLLAATEKVVDADLRQHDDVANSDASAVRSVGITYRCPGGKPPETQRQSAHLPLAYPS